MPDDDREQVYCHGCKNEWYRDEHGLACPECGSEIVEIVSNFVPIHSFSANPSQIEPQNDPRQQEEENSYSSHPLHDHNPWNNDTSDTNEDDTSLRTESTQQERRDGGAVPFTGMHPFEALFGSMLGSGMQGQQQTTRNGGWTTRTSGGTLPGGGSYSLSVASGPSWNMHHRSGSMNTGRNPNEDLSGILSQMLHFMSPPATTRFNGDANTIPSPLHPIFSLMMGPLSGSHGDVAYTQEGFDRILTMLREQHGGAGGAPPASTEAISALPRVKIAREHLDEQGKAECSICMDQVSIGEEVTMLPCNHWFHGDCIKSWLVEHDTCPQCRRGITPREGDRNQPRTTGQAPQYWQVNMDDLEGYTGGNSQRGGEESSNTTRSNGSSRSQESSGRSQHSRGNVIANMANNLMRRLSGGNNNHGNNNGASGSGSSGYNSRS
ncbi:MAG: hypothetical protein GOMPHAMPRED_005206 [Gomphillus americanus]|uniref:RING-type E3 ubiquitin transferase n=1 Tax=Gomphillus americanus TaxID=1940652 RepID=A0A8H3FRJ7_9LECA|nr:MAG: hypothetical protein GOMPHAMPRED_005206 [Gomphillus americanus]